MKLDMRHYHSGNRHKPRYWGSVWLILALTAVVVGLILLGKHDAEVRASGVIQAAQSKADVLAYKADKIQASNDELKAALARSLTFNTPENIKELSKYYIEKYFGQDAPEVEKIMTCESGLSNQTIHINKPGSGSDYGLYQLNDIYQKARFEKMFPGVKFEVGAMDWDMSSRYAKWLWDHSGSSQWICSQIVGIK